MFEIKHQKTKTIACKENGRSGDYTSGHFVLGCSHLKSDFYDNPCHYCYVARFGRKKIYINTNTDEILKQCDLAIQDKPFPKISNQVDSIYYFVDISCDTDINFMWKYYNWFFVFDYFKYHPKLAATFATKWVNTKLLDYNPESKIRVRMSLMPEKTKQILEKGTSPIMNRIKFLNKLISQGYSTHINFSPIVYYKNWLEDYKELFKMINQETTDEFKKQACSENIFLTSNEYLHNVNIQKNLHLAESFLWNPKLQEFKISNYGGQNLRYKFELKNKLIEEFKFISNEYIPWCKIRYIF